jgi:hypothetical protein
MLDGIIFFWIPACAGMTRMNRSITTSVISLLLLTVGVFVNAMELDNNHWHVYGRPITLTGTITEDEAYKSPDATKIEKYYLLTLDKPINVKGKDNSEIENDVSQIQLKIIWHGKKTILPKGNFPSLLERKVSVRGILSHADTAARAKILMAVDSIKPHKKPARSHKKHRTT